MMKMHVVIATLMIAFGGVQLANAADAAPVHSAMYSTQMQHLSKRPYQAPKPATVAADAAWQDATFRGYDRQSQQTFKLHALAKRSF
jgi:hypothetical protein